MCTKLQNKARLSPAVLRPQRGLQQLQLGAALASSELQQQLTIKHNKFALLWGEAQKKIAYSYPRVTYSYPKVT